MAKLFGSEFNTNQKDVNPENKSGQNSDSSQLAQDQDYQQLLDLYENAEFAKCMPLLEKLEEKYPGSKVLSKIKNDLKMKASLKKYTESSQKSEKINKAKSIFRIIAMIIIGVLVGAVIFYASQSLMQDDATISETQQEFDIVASLNNQAEQLLLNGNPGPAQEIIERIRSIDPDYENLSELSERTEKLLLLEEKYQSALTLLEEDNKNEALDLLKEVEAEQPGLWDVSQRIDNIENTLEVDKLIEEGNTAFQENNWGKSISAYESALLLDPSIEDQQIKEQLFRSYLNQIIIMLQAEDASIEEVNQAADYYRKAVALFPQSRQFADEREDLQELSSNLLELKYTQTAKNLLADSYQNSSTIADAVSFLRRAAKIRPNNSALQLDLQNAEYYQIAFKDFIDMRWNQAITNLEKIIEVDPNYANGNAKLLLFESYYLLGEQYYSAGFYQDAILNLEQAELLIWDDRNDNLMRLFTTEVLIGNIIGELEDYENAVSYYRYATNAIDAYSKLSDRSNLFAKYLEANDLVATENYEAAYEAFQEVLDNIDVIYSNSEIEIEESIVLAFFADDNQTTVDAILEANDLQNTMIIKRGQILTVPSLQN